MKHIPGRKREQQRKPTARMAAAVTLIAGSFCLAAVSGCNGLPASTPGPIEVPQTYLATAVGGSSPVAPTSYTIDDNADTFVQSDITADYGTTATNSGVFTVLARGLRGLGITIANASYGTSGISKTNYNPPLPGSYAVELAGQAGGVVQLVGQPAEPLAAVQNCPSLGTAQTFQFITLPGGLVNTTAPSTGTWNPATETAYGSVSVSGSGPTVNFSNIQQFTLPVNGGAPGTPANPSPSTVTGACSPTPYGNTISIPGTVTVTNPGGGPGGAETNSPTAILGIGPSGLLVEWNGTSAGSYQNALGAGTGAIGVPQPSSALETSAIVGAQYLGFIYGGGAGSGSTGWSSTLGSFGFPATPSDCSSVAPQTSTLIYGGDFPSNNPASSAVQSNGGYGNCDFAIDLGAQSATSNGLYPSATVWMGSGFSANAAQTTHSFPAVAIVGQLQGKFVILLIGKDTTQAWSAYLLQSN